MYYCGIDLGGTKIFSILIDKNGNIIAKNKIKTKLKGDINKIIDRIKECYIEMIIKAAIEEKDIIAIGVAVPSSVNIEKGIMIHAPNLNLKNIKIKELLKNSFNKPIYVDNDGNMALYGEFFFNKNIDTNSAYGIFVGTGIGGAYICNKKLIYGKNYTAGEIGHMVVKINGPKCGCGQKGCLEAIASKTGIVNYIKKQIEVKKTMTILDTIQPDWKESLGSSIIANCYKRKDKLVVKAVDRASKALGIASANIINLIGVDAIIFGGGLINELGDIMLPRIKKYMQKHCISNGYKDVKMIKSKLEDSSVAYGAARFVSLDENKNFLE